MTVDAGSLLLRLPNQSAEVAVRAATSAPEVGGYALGPGFLGGAGTPVIGAVARLGSPVLTMWGIHGNAAAVSTAATRLAEYGATLISVQGIITEDAMRAAVASAAVFGSIVVATTLDAAIDDAAAASALGQSRGKVVSRLAKRSVDLGAGAVQCALADLGVVAQVAPDAKRIVTGVFTVDEVGEALDRGGDFVVVRRDLLDEVASSE